MSEDTQVKQKRIPRMEWDQIVLGAGPPCFFVEQVDDQRPRYCARPETWRGHNGRHPFVSLRDLLATVRREAFKEAIEITKTSHAQYKNQSSLRESIIDGLRRASTTEKEEKNG